MDLKTVLLGVAMIAYGAYTAWARKAKPEQFTKLQPMKEFWGERRGNFGHTFGYTVMPIVCGILFIIAGLLGE